MEEEEAPVEKAAGKSRDDELVIKTSEQLEIVNSFDQLGIPEALLRGLYAYGFNKPSAV